MRYFLERDAVLKWLEHPAVYHLRTDELYELDDTAFQFLRRCSSETGCTGSDKEFVDFCLREGILSAQRVISRRPELFPAPFPSLRYLELQITTGCNLRCGHCYITDCETESTSQRRPDELSLGQMRAIFHEFEEMQGLRVLISGGEPLMHSQFEGINAMLPEFFFRTILITNGILLTKQTLDTLNVSEIQVSIDGLEQAHDSLRGKGTFHAAMKAVRSAMEAGVPVSVSTMVHQGNLRDFDALEKLFRELGVKDWTVDVPCITGRLREHPEFQISPAVGGKYLRYGYGEGLHAGMSGFACGAHLMAVMADGKVAKCTFFAESSVGRIDEGLKANWRRIQPVRLEELSCDCDYLAECRGGCRYRAMLFGDRLGKDYYKCHAFDKLSHNA